MGTKKKLKWITKGKTKDDQGSIKENHDIDVFEAVPNIGGSSCDSFGIPITAELGVDMIRKLWETIKPREYEEAESDVDRKKALKRFDIDEIKRVLSEGTGADKVDVLQLLLDQFCISTFAVTFSKSVLLKTLSQPSCEAVRFYLCLRETAEKFIDNETPRLSLVVVGVDAEGGDLLYQYIPCQHPQGPGIASLVDEYGATANRLSFNVKDDNLDDYALFRYALKQPKEESQTVSHP